MATVRALIIKDDGPFEYVDVEGDLKTLQGIVGGYLEGIGPADFREEGGKWHAYCDEEGKIKRLPVNRAATILALAGGWHMGDVLCGPVVFLGSTRDGDEADVPPKLVELARVSFLGDLVVTLPVPEGKEPPAAPVEADGFSERDAFVVRRDA